jgi:hypothetical protein
VPSLFRRSKDDAAVTTAETEPVEVVAPRPKSYTPSKKELGVVTPKRQAAGRRVDAVPANSKDALKQTRERQRAERAEASAGMRAGDERYLTPRDRGPERRLVRNIVDSRRTVGTWFFGGALIVLLGSSTKMPPIVQLGANLLWAILALGVIIDSVLISRKIKRLVTERFPDTKVRVGSLYLYGIMRGLTFRRMRTPKAQVEIGAKV